MKANEFVKKFGLSHSKLFGNGWITFDDGCIENSVSRTDVKLLVESHELVESKGGLDAAKNIVKSQHNLYTDMRLVQAIQDVEACL